MRITKVLGNNPGSNTTLKILSIKLGSDQRGAEVVKHLRDLIPGIWIAGVDERFDTDNSIFNITVTSHRDAYLGHYELANVTALSMTPELYTLVAPFEGQALSMLDRIKFHDPSDYPARPSGADRYEDSFDERADLFARHCCFWNSIFDKHEIQAVISQNFGHQGFDFVALSLAEAKGIPTLIFNETGQFPQVQFVQENVQKLGDLELGKLLKINIASEMAQEKPDFIRRSLSKFQPVPDRFGAPGRYATSPTKSWLMDLNVRITQPSQRVIISILIKKTFRLLLNPKKRLMMVKRTLGKIQRTRKSMMEESKYTSLPNLDSNFIYFPLPYQPEATTSVKGRHFYRLREAVSFIASQLPPGWSLIVKEHPHQWRRLLPRRPGFFAHLSSIPRVHLVHHTSDNTLLVRHARAVACVSHSSITAHAVANGKLVISLGSSHFRQAPNYHCVSSTDSLKSTMKIIAGTSDIQHSSSFEDFIQELEQGTFEGLLGYDFQSGNPDEDLRINQVTHRNLSLVIREWMRIRGLLN